MRALTVVSAPDPLGDSVSAAVLLAGPASPDPATSWQAEAIASFERQSFRGELFDPVGSGRAWELEASAVADVVVFWFPAGSTSVGADLALDLGQAIAEGRALLGTDASAPADEELVDVAARSGLDLHRTIDELVAATLVALGPAALRRGPDRFVPLAVWRSPSFQSWRRALDEAGHRTEDLRVLWRWPTPASEPPFAWIAQPRIAVVGEDRAKANEIVVGRPDMAAVCAWGHDAAGRLEVVLVREFRSPTGHVLGLPGGSIDDSSGPRQAAAREFDEEVGVLVDPARLTACGARRSLGTLSTHTEHLFSVELTTDELDALRRDDRTHGVGEHERTTVAVIAFADLDRLPNVDWSTLGMVRQALDPVGGRR